MFEMLEFEWQRRGRYPRPPLRKAPMQARLLRRRPVPGPSRSLWPYRVPVFEPIPLVQPEPEPGDQPEPAGMPGPGDGGGAEELSERLRRHVNRMPPGQRPQFRNIGPLASAPNNADARAAGLYYIEFNVNGRRRGYSGQSKNIAERLKQHRLCARVMGLNADLMTVFIATGLDDDAERRGLEWLMHDRVFFHYPKQLTNQKRELELEMPGAGHAESCGCKRCRHLPLTEEQEMELAMELLSVQSEEELEQFLGKVFKGVWKGIKKVAKPLGGILKGIAKKALPFVGGALGSLIPVPGVGTALGSALGGALSKALEMETQFMEAEEREFETARRFVRIAAGAAQAAGAGDGSPQAARRAVLDALRRHAPGFGQL